MLLIAELGCYLTRDDITDHLAKKRYLFWVHAAICQHTRIAYVNQSQQREASLISITIQGLRRIAMKPDNSLGATNERVIKLLFYFTITLFRLPGSGSRMLDNPEFDLTPRTDADRPHLERSLPSFVCEVIAQRDHLASDRVPSVLRHILLIFTTLEDLRKIHSRSMKRGLLSLSRLYLLHDVTLPAGQPQVCPRWPRRRPGE